MAKNPMMDLQRHQQRMSRKTLFSLIGGGVLLVALIVWLTAVLHPLPPRTITLACGPEGSAYEVFGKRYQKLLLKQGVHVRLINTAGGVENLALLNKAGSGVDLGFVEGGVATETDEADLISLGTLTYEPVWLFTRHLPTAKGFAGLKGMRVAVGPDGSSGRAILEELAKRKALDLSTFKMLTMEAEESSNALLAGRIDAAVLVNSWASPAVRQLVKDPGIDTISFSRADAYAALFPSLTKRVLPAGAADLEKDLPSHDVTLLATKTSLIARGNLNPGLQYLVLEMLTQVHSRPGIFQRSAEFPAPEAMEIPLSPEAQHFYKSGRPFLQRYLPFWLAALVEQLLLLMIPILGLTYPLVKGVMSLYGWGMQRRIFSIYGELHWLEGQLDKLGNGPLPEELKVRMKHLEDRTHRVKVTSNYMPMLYSLKDTLATVRRRLDQQAQAR